MAMVMLIGHGGWDLTDPPYAQVPRGTTIHFYLESGRTWVGANMLQSLTLSDAFKDAEPNQSGEEYKSIPNYTLSELDAETKAYLQSLDPGSYTSIYVDVDTKLCNDEAGDTCGNGIHGCGGLFADPRVVGNEVYWMACRATELASVPSDETPVPDEERIDQVQFTLGYAPQGTPDQVSAEMMTEIADAFAAVSEDERNDGWAEFDDDWKQMLLTDPRFAAMFPNG